MCLFCQAGWSTCVGSGGINVGPVAGWCYIGLGALLKLSLLLLLLQLAENELKLPVGRGTRIVPLGPSQAGLVSLSSPSVHVPHVR